MKVKIICEHPDSMLCKVVNAETGELIHGIQRVDFVADIHAPGRLIRATLYMTDVAIEATVDANITEDYALLRALGGV